MENVAGTFEFGVLVVLITLVHRPFPRLMFWRPQSSVSAARAAIGAAATIIPVVITAASASRRLMILGDDDDDDSVVSC